MPCEPRSGISGSHAISVKYMFKIKRVNYKEIHIINEKYILHVQFPGETQITEIDSQKNRKTTMNQ